MSPYTLQKYTEFTSKRAIWSTYTDANKVIQELDEFLAQVNAELPNQALDLEQEQLFWESSVRMGKFEYIFWTPGDVDLKKIRLELKDQMKRNKAFIDKRKKAKNTAPLLHMISGDVTGCYITFSIAAAIFRGYSVKTHYEDAIEGNTNIWAAHTGLAQWYFYAPGICGGSNKKAGKHFKAAVDCSKTDADKFYTYIYYSQFLFEDKQKDLAADYLNKAEKLFPGNRLTKQIKELNAKNVSFLQYNREHTGVDSNTDPNAKELE